ncbi:hypothetical protein [Brevibacillus nitrificans]|uniref:hypothetical protein n=1 Tax=Brevibacillus nitrificans TaxID=651560 RepID=UPI002622C950|nr:hypothetical protein [Brevibacillus nitrificans]MED1795358.1 hypothetical protein [Brevibacillus nitrificans]
MGIYSVIDHRAWKVLQNVAADFSSFAAIEGISNNRIKLDGGKLGIVDLQASYRIINKWMGRVYVYTWSWALPDPSLPDDMKITCRYTGTWKSPKTVQFVSKQPSPLLEALNRDEKIQKLCQTVDYEAIELSYSKREGRWQVEMRPNYGDFIWILLPPVRYARRPKQQEITDTMTLINRLTKLITQRSKEV